MNVKSLTFGLNWNHPAVLLNLTALAADAIVQLLSNFAVALPVGVTPYQRLVVGGVAMYGMSLYCLSKSGTRLGDFIGYAMAALNLLTSLGFVLILIAYVQGPGSSLWNLLLIA
jgi:hypothetical protein